MKDRLALLLISQPGTMNSQSGMWSLKISTVSVISSPEGLSVGYTWGWDSDGGDRPHSSP